MKKFPVFFVNLIFVVHQLRFAYKRTNYSSLYLFTTVFHICSLLLNYWDVLKVQFLYFHRFAKFYLTSLSIVLPNIYLLIAYEPFPEIRMNFFIFVEFLNTNV